MGTYTPNLGFYKPAGHEGLTGAPYTIPNNANWLLLDILLGGTGKSIANVMDPRFAGGAKGDNTTNDSAAIQAAINSNAAIVYFPGVLTTYRASGLVPRAGQHYLGDGGTFEGYASSASRLKAVSNGQSIWSITTAMGYITWENLVMVGTSTTTSDNTTAFNIAGTYLSQCYFKNVVFHWTKWAINCGTTGWFLSNWFDHCSFESASIQLGTGANGYMNNNHWKGCTFHASGWTVPAVDIAGAAPAQGNYFSHCYFESLLRQAIRVTSAQGFGVRESYFEAIGDGTTYTAKDGRTRALPAIDICNSATVGTSHGVVIEENHFVGEGASTYLVYGSTAFPHASLNKDITTQGNSMEATNGVDAVWDASAFRWVHGGGFQEQADIRNTLGMGPASFPGGIMPSHDALLADTWYMEPGSSANFTIPNPTSPTDGRRLRYIFVNDSNLLGTITWGSQYQFTNGPWVNPPLGAKCIIDFEYCGVLADLSYSQTTGKWVEVWRSPATLKGSKTWDPASIATGATTTTTVTVTGAAVGDVATAGFSVAVPAGMLLTASVTAADTVTVTLYNVSATNPTDLASGTLVARVWRN